MEGSRSVKGRAPGTISVVVSCDAEDGTEGRSSRRDSLKRKCVLSTKQDVSLKGTQMEEVKFLVFASLPVFNIAVYLPGLKKIQSACTRLI